MSRTRARRVAGGCLLLIALGAAPGPALAQAGAWHMVAGQRAWKDPRAAPLVIELGQRLDVAPGHPGIEVTLADTPTPGARAVVRICCRALGRMAARCSSDRGVALGASRTFVIGRYGASRSPGSRLRQLNYPGIQFSFDAFGRTEQICVVPAQP